MKNKHFVLHLELQTFFALEEEPWRSKAGLFSIYISKKMKDKTKYPENVMGILNLMYWLVKVAASFHFHFKLVCMCMCVLFPGTLSFFVPNSSFTAINNK